MSEYAFEIILPPSMNNVYVNNPHTRGRFMSAEGKKFKEMALNTLPKIAATMEGPIEVIYEYWFPNRMRRDIANYEKVVTDVLVTGGVILDDCQIERLTLVKREIDKENPRMRGLLRQITPQENAPPQRSLSLEPVGVEKKTDDQKSDHQA